VFDGPPGEWGQKRLPVKLSRFHEASATAQAPAQL
jgi:hypothetical protein